MAEAAVAHDRSIHIRHALKQFVFLGVQLGSLLVIWSGWSWFAVAVCAFLYIIRMFAITGGYHRYFSHRSYNTSRWFQFVLAALGAASAQKGPLWWASHHRHHHRYSDTEHDLHAPKIRGVWWAHMGWVMSAEFLTSRLELVKDLLVFPEIRAVERWHLIPPLLLAVGLYFSGNLLAASWPELGTNGFQLLVWGFFISTTLLYHGTFLVNSFTHIVGSRRFNTNDESRNSLWIALVTMGEGWHNNHHRYPGSERQGFYWWEIDCTHYILKALSWLGIVWDLRTPPQRIYEEALNREQAA